MRNFSGEADGLMTQQLNDSRQAAYPDSSITGHRGLQAPSSKSSGLYRHGGKRLFDITLSILALAALSPVFAVVWSVLRFRLGSGVVLRQQRLGRGARPFGMLKFRTMQECRRTQSGGTAWNSVDRRITHKSDRDPRHTTLGKLFRKLSLDELPQLVNVLKGDMSLVGPRPELAAEASEAFSAHPRHQVRPGLTGPFQVSDLRKTGNLSLGLEQDESYVDELCLRSDTKYLVQTWTAVFGRTGS